MSESDQEFLLRMGAVVNSECWGTPEQEADQARITSIANRLHDMNYQLAMYTKHNNPHGYTIKYGRDHGERKTLGALVDNLIEAAPSLSDDRKLSDFIDQEFLFGCWANELEMRNPDMLRDLRALIVTLLRKAMSCAVTETPTCKKCGATPTGPKLEGWFRDTFFQGDGYFCPNCRPEEPGASGTTVCPGCRLGFWY